MGQGKSVFVQKDLRLRRDAFLSFLTLAKFSYINHLIRNVCIFHPYLNLNLAKEKAAKLLLTVNA